MLLVLLPLSYLLDADMRLRVEWYFGGRDEHCIPRMVELPSPGSCPPILGLLHEEEINFCLV